MSHLSLTIGVLATLAQTLTIPAVAPKPRLAGPTLSRSRQPAPPPGDVAEHVAPRVVCGMVVVPVNATVDPRMVVPPPSDVSFKMKVIVPPVCVD